MVHAITKFFDHSMDVHLTSLNQQQSCWTKWNAMGKVHFLTQPNSWTTWCVLSYIDIYIYVYIYHGCWTWPYNLVEHPIWPQAEGTSHSTKTIYKNLMHSGRSSTEWFLNHFEGFHKFYFGTPKITSTKCYRSLFNLHWMVVISEKYQTLLGSSINTPGMQPPCQLRNRSRNQTGKSERSTCHR
jgi:hypothetical protein